MKRKKEKSLESCGVACDRCGFFHFNPGDKALCGLVWIDGACDSGRIGGPYRSIPDGCIGGRHCCFFEKWPDSDTSHHQRGRRRIYHKRMPTRRKIQGNGSGKHHWYGCVLHSLSWLRDYVVAGIQYLVIGVAVLLLFLILLFSGVQESEKTKITNWKRKKMKKEK